MTRKPVGTAARLRAQSDDLRARARAMEEEERNRRLALSALEHAGFVECLTGLLPCPVNEGQARRREWAKDFVARLPLILAKAKEKEGAPAPGKANAPQGEASDDRLETISLRPMPPLRDGEDPYPAFLLREALHGGSSSPKVAAAAAAWREAVSDLARIKDLEGVLATRLEAIRGSEGMREETRLLESSLPLAREQLRRASAMRKNQPGAEGKR